MERRDINIDSEFKALIPPLTSEEFAMLRDDIKRHGGCIDKLIVWREEKILLDGHNRIQICDEFDLPFEVEEMPFHGRTDAMLWMIRHQLARRNLSDAARVSLCLKLKPAIAAKAKENQQVSPGPKGLANSPNLSAPVEQVNTREEIAKAAGVGSNTVSRVIKVLKEATEPVKQAMLSGETTVRQAYLTVQNPPKEQSVESKAPESASAPIKPRGVGIEHAHEAIACLKKIPKADALRESAFQLVRDWMKTNL